MSKNKDGGFKKKHKTEWHDFLWKRFLDRFTGDKSKQAINSIFSDYEKHLITKRLAALALMREGVGTREISRLIWLSRSTISALKKSFFVRPVTYKSHRSFSRLIKNNRVISIKDVKHGWLADLFKGVDLWELIKNPPRPPGIGIKG